MKKSKLSLLSALIATLYLFYIISYFFDSVSNSEGSEQIGAGIAALLVAPHMFLLGLGVLFNWIGFFLNERWSILVGAILYSVSGLVFILYVFFVIPSIVLSFIAYSKLKKADIKPQVSAV